MVANHLTLLISTGGFSMKTGHFTQVVWRDTREVGCGKSQCNGLDV